MIPALYILFGIGIGICGTRFVSLWTEWISLKKQIAESQRKYPELWDEWSKKWENDKK